MKQQYFGKLCQDRITQSNLGVSENGGIPEIRTNIAFLMEGNETNPDEPRCLDVSLISLGICLNYLTSGTQPV